MGVDLNRNYPFGWSFSCAGSSSQRSETYKGPQAFSEPETRTMIAFQADRQFAKLLDLHAYARDVRQNYGTCAQLPKAVDDEYGVITSSVATPMKYASVRSCCTGGDITQAYHAHGTMSLLVEIGTAFQPAYATTVAEINDRVLPGVMAFLSKPIPASGRVVDKDTGAAVAGAVITLPQLAFNYGEQVHSSPSGRYHLWLPDGDYEVTVESTDKTPFRGTITAKAGGLITDIEM